MAESFDYDLVILGGGAAAFAAITEADRLGLSTAIVNAGLPLGGTCVNVGCVPSKHLLAVSHTACEPPRNPFSAVVYDDVDQPTTDWRQMMDEKDELIEALREENYRNVADHHGTDVYEGYGRFVDDTTIHIKDGPDAGTKLTGETALVATGSAPVIPPIGGLDEIEYETSESILERETQPESVVMIGGGYIGLEWGQILHQLGTAVTIIEMEDRPLPRMDPDIGREIHGIFEDDGIEIVTDATVTEVGVSDEIASDGGMSAVESRRYADVEMADETVRCEASTIFLATGVKPNTNDIGLESIGVETTETGAIDIDDRMQTSNATVYAAGDCTDTIALETVAAKEGNLAVKNAFDGANRSIDYDTVPEVVFTSPEIASVGVTESEYAERGRNSDTRRVEYEDVPKAKAVKNTDGFVKVVIDADTDEIVGVQMVGPRVGDLIPEATLAVKYGLAVDDIVDTIHPFPTFSEGFKQACQAFRRDISTMSCCVE